MVFRGVTEVVAGRQPSELSTMDFHGVSWIFTDSVGFLCIVMGFPGSDRIGRKPSTKRTILPLDFY